VDKVGNLLIWRAIVAASVYSTPAQAKNGRNFSLFEQRLMPKGGEKLLINRSLRFRASKCSSKLGKVWGWNERET
jgi:hypothetical protein